MTSQLFRGPAGVLVSSTAVPCSSFLAHETPDHPLLVPHQLHPLTLLDDVAKVIANDVCDKLSQTVDALHLVTQAKHPDGVASGDGARLLKSSLAQWNQTLEQ